jgi:hypothetical protein
MKKKRRCHRIGKKVTINWYFEEDDEDIYFAGNDYKALINKVEFNLIELKQN